jgi:hypothetical protein
MRRNALPVVHIRMPFVDACLHGHRRTAPRRRPHPDSAPECSARKGRTERTVAMNGSVQKKCAFFRVGPHFPTTSAISRLYIYGTMKRPSTTDTSPMPSELDAPNGELDLRGQGASPKMTNRENFIFGHEKSRNVTFGHLCPPTPPPLAWFRMFGGHPSLAARRPPQTRKIHFLVTFGNLW